MSKVKFTSISSFDGFEGMLNVEELWTNSNPTSSFAGQSIPLDLSKYELLLIIFRWSSSDPGTLTSITKVDKSGQVMALYDEKIYRSFNTSTSGVTFNDARASSSATGSMSVSNTKCIPQVIYGIN